MIKLETHFFSSVGGFGQEKLEYNQIKRTDKFAIYSRSKNGKLRDYEVIRINIDPKGKVQTFPNGITKVVEDDTEKYANTSRWGFDGWSYANIVPAMAKFDELVNGKVEAVTEVVEEAVTSVEDAIGGDTNEVNNDTAVETPVKRRGKAKIERPALVIPNKDKFAMIDLEAANPAPWTKPMIYLEIKQQLADGKIKEAGYADNTGKRGKAPALYSLA